MTEEVQVKKKKSWFGRLLRWFFYVLLLLLLITLLLQLSSVQNWLGQKITNYLSDKTETNISFESVDVSVTKGKSNFSKILARLTQADKPENDDAKPLSLDLDKVNLQGPDLTA